MKEEPEEPVEDAWGSPKLEAIGVEQEQAQHGPERLECVDKHNLGVRRCPTYLLGEHARSGEVPLPHIRRQDRDGPGAVVHQRTV